MEILPAVVEVRPLEVGEEPESELVEAPGGPTLPVARAAAVVAGGFVAGAATMALVRRAAGRPALRGRRRRDLRRVEVVSSQSFLVDVHVIDHR